MPSVIYGHFRNLFSVLGGLRHQGTDSRLGSKESLLRNARGFLKERKAAVAVEFAMVGAPLLLIILEIFRGPVFRAHALAAKLRQSVMAFCRARQAIAAAEFALVLPLFVTLMLGSVEVARLITFARKVTLVATTAVEMLSQNGTGTVNYIDLDFAIDSTMVIFSQILQDAAQKEIPWNNDIAISMASVLFTPNTSTCTSNCSYAANVVWNSGPNKRTCGFN